MMSGIGNQRQPVRDGRETLPEPLEIENITPFSKKWQDEDDGLDEALKETFPASDPPASGQFE